MKSFLLAILVILSTAISKAHDSIPPRICDTVVMLSNWSDSYDTLLVKYNSLGREIETSYISAIDKDYNNSWYRYTTNYDSLGREIGGTIYGINPLRNSPLFYVNDTLIGERDTTLVSINYKSDTVYTTWDFLKYRTNHRPSVKSISYEVKNSNGQTVEVTELNDIGGFKSQKRIFRDSLTQTKIEVTKHYKKTGMLRYIETDSVYCDSSKVKFIVKKTSKENAKAFKYDCENCTIYYTNDTTGNVTKITMHNAEGDTLVTQDFVYDKHGNLLSNRKKEIAGDSEETVWKYNRYGHLIECIKKENDQIVGYWKYLIAYRKDP